MSALKAAAKKKNLLLCFDAFGTLFTPSKPIPTAYAQVAARYGIDCGNDDAPRAVGASFKQAFKEQSKLNPNYGKATSLGAEKWWANREVIRNTFQSFLKPGQEVPHALVTDLLTRYSTKDGYKLYDDVKPFFRALRSQELSKPRETSLAWDKIVVGIITNSDDRVPSVLESFGLKIGPRRVGTVDERRREASLEDDVSFVVLSYDVGVEKPDPQIFDAATDMLKDTLAGNDEGLTMDSFGKIYVGDDVEKDYDGARAAGWDSLWLNRESRAEDHDMERDRDVIRSLSELVAFRERQ